MITLWQMLPCSVGNNIVNGRFPYTKLYGEFCQPFAASVPTSYLGDLRGREFGNARARALRLPSLCNLVSHVGSGCAKKEVIWIAARRIVALVANAFAFFYRAASQCVSYSMRSRQAVKSAVAFGSIAILVFCALPFPAIVWAASVNAIPETLFFGERGRVKATVPANVAQRLAFDVASSFVIVFGYVRWLAATAVAITVGNLVRGMISHSNSPFSTLLTPPNGSRRCGGNFIGCYSFIIPQGGTL